MRAPRLADAASRAVMQGVCVDDSDCGQPHILEDSIAIRPLKDCPEHIEEIARQLEIEWPEYYGEGFSNAREEVRGYACASVLPYGFVALNENVACGFMAVRSDCLHSHSHLGPWVVCGLVRPQMRGSGIGERLLQAIERHAWRHRIPALYAASATCHNLLLRARWYKMDEVAHFGERLGVYTKRLEVESTVQ
ncbi:MAG: GNAT family N-acetyltransferase [Pseudomonadota bacterium]